MSSSYAAMHNNLILGGLFCTVCTELVCNRNSTVLGQGPGGATAPLAPPLSTALEYVPYAHF